MSARRARPRAGARGGLRRAFGAAAAAALAWLVAPAAPAAADVLLGVPERAQEHDQWCWAGSAQAMLTHYGAVVPQCTIANWSFDRVDCCGSADFGWSHACNFWNYMWGDSAYGNAGRSLQGILAHWGVATNVQYGALSQATSVAEINAGRPFVIRFGWATGGGHFLVGYGYDQAGTYVDYMDPWPGNGFTKSLYSWTVYAPGHHDWTHTLQSTTNPAARAELTPFKLPGWSKAIVVSRRKGTHLDSPALKSTETLYVDWAVKNVGAAATAPPFVTRLYVDGALKRTWTRSTPLAPGGVVIGQDFAIGPLAPGQHQLRVVTDAANAVSEPNEANNAFSRRVTVY